MQSIVLQIDVFAAVALRPSRSQKYPRARRNFAVLALPVFYRLWCEQKIRIRFHLRGYIDDASGADELVCGNPVDAVVGQVLAAHPMDGRIEMRAGMFAGGECVPVPRRAALVIPREFVQLESGSVGELRRQRKDGRVGA